MSRFLGLNMKTEEGIIDGLRILNQLTDEIAQNIMNIFAEKVSRVGVNPSEWLRLRGKNNA